MTKHDAIEILEEVKMLDDSMFAYSQAYNDALEMAIEALKAQKPIEPVPAIDNVGDWLCGNCYQSVVGYEELDASGFTPVKFDFCPKCGRAVKWE